MSTFLLKPVKPTKFKFQIDPSLKTLNAASRVDGDDECAAVGLEGEDGAHDVLRLTADPLAELVEGFEVGLVEGVADDLDVHLVQVLLVYAALEEGGWGNKAS